MIAYSDIKIPSRTKHLWRYTPWRRVHPSKVEEIPDASALSISLGESGSMLEESNEIARAFLGECSAETRDISLNDEKSELELVATGEITCSSLRINSVGVSVLRIRLSGNPKWVGLRIEGVVSGTLSVVLINDLGADVHLLRCEDWDIKRDSLLELATLSYGGFLIKSDIRANLLESGAQFTGGIASHGHVARHDDHHVEISHMGKHTNSSLIVHSACGDSSHSIGTGLLKIGEDANGSDAGQVFRNILFSEKARADSIPELEVLSDDVKAAHGAASAPVDKEQVHYLMSRGLNNSESESLIIEGFLMDAFREIKNTTILDAIRTRLLVHLDCLVKG